MTGSFDYCLQFEMKFFINILQTGECCSQSGIKIKMNIVRNALSNFFLAGGSENFGTLRQQCQKNVPNVRNQTKAIKFPIIVVGRHFVQDSDGESTRGVKAVDV